jgi:hypothetical protein
MYGRGSINSTIVTRPRFAPSPFDPPADLRRIFRALLIRRLVVPRVNVPRIGAAG